MTQGIATHLTAETRFHVTSIHDVTLRDAWSKVVQGCMEVQPDIEALLLNFSDVSGTFSQ